MTEAKHSGEELFGVELSLWAMEAKECPLCKLVWTPYTIGEREARVVNLCPRMLACEDCLVGRGAKALRADLGLMD